MTSPSTSGSSMVPHVLASHRFYFDLILAASPTINYIVLHYSQMTVPHYLRKIRYASTASELKSNMQRVSKMVGTTRLMYNQICHFSHPDEEQYLTQLDVFR